MNRKAMPNAKQYRHSNRQWPRHGQRYAVIHVNRWSCKVRQKCSKVGLHPVRDDAGK